MLLFLLVIQLIEIGIPMVMYGYMEYFLRLLETSKLVILSAVLLALVGLYLWASHQGISLSRGLIIQFINELRRSWLTLFLKKPASKLTLNDTASFFTKVTYHFSLVKMGLYQVIVYSLQFILLTLALLIFGLIFSTPVLIGTGLVLFFSLGVFYLGYIVSKYYISQDQTLYSHILHVVAKSLSNVYAIQTAQNENRLLSYFDEMVNLDSHFRLKREMWIQMTDKLLFAFISMTVGIFAFIQLYFPFFEIQNLFQGLAYTVILGLYIKQVYLAMHIGINTFPLKLGLSLSVPETPVEPIRRSQVPSEILTLNFRTKKMKFERQGSYLKALEFNFSAGNQVFIYSPEAEKLRYFSTLFAGSLPDYLAKGWIVHLNQKRELYKYYKRSQLKRLHLPDQIHLSGTLFEFLSNTCVEATIPQNQSLAITKQLSEIEGFDFIFKLPKALGSDVSLLSHRQKALLVLAHALFHPPTLLIIDALWVDLNDLSFKAILKKVLEASPKIIMVRLSTSKTFISSNDLVHSF